MSAIETLAGTPLAGAIGWTLLHSLWEGAIIALGLAVTIVATRSPRIRYAAACSAMLVLVSAWGVTFVRAMPEAGRIVTASVRADRPAWNITSGTADNGSLTAELGTIAPWLAPLWIAGVWIFALRHAASYISTYRLRHRGVCSAPERWQHDLARLCAQLRIARPVALLESALAETPAVLGHLRPVILMPVGLLAGLPVAQVEAVLLHELAHVRRCDYLVNVFQRLLEAFFFYHPVAWWISGVLRSERENCCDDFVVALTGDAHDYATALTAIENNRWSDARLSVAATGGNLVKRVRRLLYPSAPKTGGMPLIAASVLVLASAVGLFAWQQPDQPVAGAQEQGGYSSPYDRWVNEDVAYIISDRERAAFQKLTTDEERAKFVEQFWQRRDPTPGTPENEFKTEHYRRIAYANEHFASTQPGWKTDRGHIYIVFGPPDEIEAHPAGRSGSPAPSQQWMYHHIDGIGDRVIVQFRDSTGAGDYRMTIDPRAVSAIGRVNQQQFENFNSSERVRVPAAIQDKSLVVKIDPIYPPLAMQARVQGTVRFNILVDKQGKVANVQLISGHPLLVNAAVDAVRQWVYKPTLLNGEPVEVTTQVDVNFSLNQ
jgi:TonB family protein